MRAMQVTGYGDADVLRLATVERPQLDASSVLVAVEVAGVNFLDVQVRRGVFGIPTPFTAGFEGAGVILEVGADVEGLEVGQRVVWSNVLGSYADVAAVPGFRAVPIPEHIPSDIAVAAQVQGITAHYLVNDVYPVAPDDTIVVHAGAGGVGGLLVQLAKARGARVIATVSSVAKADIARRRGADHVVRYDELDARAAELTGGRGVAAVFDGVGETTYRDSVRALSVRGTLVLYGEASGPVPAFDPAELGGRSITVVRPSFGDFTRTAEEVRDHTAAVFEEISAGRIVVDAGTTLPLEQAAEAHALLESRRSAGKIVLRVS